jgi:Secretion system C-terminal sorting domain/FG-GAP-like repeat
MKSLINTIIVFLFVGFVGHGQQLLFTNINANLEDLGFSNAAWGDYDHDGDLDLVLTGEPGSTIPVTKIYRNDSGSFVDIQANIPGFTYSSVEWGDYDNDSDLDLLITGNDSLGNPATKIFRNDNGTFTDILAGLPSVAQGNATWGDFDNDNDLDILLAGNLQSKIMRNDGNGLFTDIGFHFPLVQSAFCSWVDYNNDGWLDALIGGDLGGVYVTTLYKNDHGTFEEDSAGFMGLSAGCAKWGDLNNDGEKDLVLGGMDPNLEGHFVIYKNNGNGQFELIENYTFSLLNPFIDLGDYDNDGYLDIILIGRIQGCGGNAVNMLYHNEGSFVFSDISTLIQGFRQGSASWGDYNNDGYTDLLFTGFNGDNFPQTQIYINNAGSGIFATNTPPAIPTDLETIVTDNNVQLRWHKSTDDQTPAGGLSYNIFIGTSQGVADIINPLSDLSTGFRRVAVLGNTNKDTTWNIHDLDAGNYYWSVQAVDNGFLGSGFGSPQMFAIYPAGMNEDKDNDITIFPNPFTDKVYFRNTDQKDAVIEIYDPKGEMIFKTTHLLHELDLSGLAKGVYLMKIKTADQMILKKLVKE